MTIESKIDDIMKLVQDKEPAITKQEMQELLDDKVQQEEQSTYREVSEKPVVVDIMDISDAAAKKLASIMTPEQQNVQVAPEQPDKPTSIVGKLLGFAKDIFMKILKVIGHAVGWVVGTLTSLLSQLSKWVLERIQAAVVISITKSVSGSMGRMGRFGGRFGFLKGALAFGGGTAALLSGINMLEGFNKVDSQLQNINDQTQAVFADPESMISAGAASMPTFSDLGSGDMGSDASTDTGGGGGDSTVEDESEDQEDDVQDLSEQIENPPVTLDSIDTDLDLPAGDPRSDEQVEQDETILQSTEAPQPATQTVDDKTAAAQLTNAGMFAGAEQLQPEDTLGETMSGLQESLKNMNQNIDISMSQAGDSTASTGGAASPSAGPSMPSMSTPTGSMSQSQPVKSSTASPAAVSRTPMASEASEAITPAQDLSMMPAEQIASPDTTNVNIKTAGDQIAPLLTALEQVPQQFESAMDAGMSSSDKLTTASSSAKPMTGSMSSQSITKPSAAIPPSPATSSSPRSTLAAPGPAQVAESTTDPMLQRLREASDATHESMESLKASVSNRQQNIVNNEVIQNQSSTDFITNTDTQRKRTRNNRFS